MQSLLKERGEYFTANEIRKVYIYSGLEWKASDYFGNSVKNPLFVMGERGSGKTMVIKKAIADEIRTNEKSFPVMFIYKNSNKVELLEPNNLESSEAWGEDRYEKIRNMENVDQIIEAANPLILDDIHYMFEGVVTGQQQPGILIETLKLFASESEKGKKTVLISEDPMGFYAEKLNIEELNELMPKFGQLPYHIYQEDPIKYREYRNKLQPTFFEIEKMNFYQWQELHKKYNIEAAPEVMSLLYDVSDNPRSLIKFAKKFSDPNKNKTVITFEDIVERAKKILPKKISSKKDLDFYNFMLGLPIIKSFDEIYNTYKDLYKLRPLRKSGNIKEIAGRIAKDLEVSPKELHPVYRTADVSKKINYEMISNKVNEFCEERGWEVEHPDKKKKLYYDAVDYFTDEKTQKLFIKYKDIVENPRKFESAYRNHKALFRYPERHYEREFGRWTLRQPLEVAFEDSLFEESTMNVIRYHLESAFNL